MGARNQGRIGLSLKIMLGLSRFMPDTASLPSRVAPCFVLALPALLTGALLPTRPLEHAHATGEQDTPPAENAFLPHLSSHDIMARRETTRNPFS